MTNAHDRAALVAPEIAPYLRAGEHGLAVPGCRSCGRLQWPPRPRCRACGGETFGPEPVPARGRLFSWTTTHRTADPAFAGLTPFTVVIVELATTPPLRMLGRLQQTGRVPDLQIGDPMVAVVETDGSGADLVHWRRP